ECLPAEYQDRRVRTGLAVRHRDVAGAVSGRRDLNAVVARPGPGALSPVGEARIDRVSGHLPSVGEHVWEAGESAISWINAAGPASGIAASQGRATLSRRTRVRTPPT